MALILIKLIEIYKKIEKKVRKNIAQTVVGGQINRIFLIKLVANVLFPDSGRLFNAEQHIIRSPDNHISKDV